MMSDWQPIETAPKDGTVIILYNRRGIVAAGAWLNIDGFPWEFFDGTTETNGWGAVSVTHWQPLPEPPHA